MNKTKIYVGLLIFLDVILLGVCGYYYMTRDKYSPHLDFSSSEVIYTSDMDKSLLLDGVSAVDGKDGDITDRIVIEKILENRKTDVAVVYYAVGDYSGNVAKASREFKAMYDTEEMYTVDDAETDIAEEDKTEATAEVDNKAEKDKENTIEADEQEKAEKEKAEKEKAEQEKAEKEKAEKEKAAKEKAEKEKAAKEKAEKEKAQKEQPQSAEPEVAIEQTNNAPRIEVKSKDFRIPVGANLAWTEVILGLYDDKDDYGYLFKNIVSTKYDNSQKGDYTVSLYTVDSDKNVSNTVTITVHVV